MAIRVCSGYHTVSAEASYVIASFPPLGLLAQEHVDQQADMEERQTRKRQPAIMLAGEMDRQTNRSFGKDHHTKFSRLGKEDTW